MEAIFKRLTEGDKALENYDYSKSSEIYLACSKEMKQLLLSIKDEKSRKLVSEKADEYGRLGRKLKNKANVNAEKQFTERLNNLKGGKTKAELSEQEANLQARFKNLIGEDSINKKSTTTEEELSDRLKKLGPSQFPKKVDKSGEQLELEMFLNNAQKNVDEPFNLDDVKDEKLKDLLRQMNDMHGDDDALQVLLGEFGSDIETQDQVQECIEKAKEFARFNDQSISFESSSEKNKKETYDEITSGSDHLTTSSEDDLSSDQEDDFKNKKKKSNKKKSKKKSWGLF